MKKNFRKVSVILALAMGMTLLSECSKKDEVSHSGMIDKYSACCTLGEYKGLEYEGISTVVTDEIMKAEMEYLLSYYATSEEVMEGTAKEGDTVNIDFTGTVDGVEFEGGSTGGAGYELTLGAGRMIDGFEEQIMGHDVGETFDIHVTFPENYGKEELNGKDAVFEITINSIIETTLPELTDEFLATNTGYTTVEELEQEIIDSYAENDAITNKSTLIELVIANSTINEYPENAMEELVDTTVENTRKEAESYGYDLETYVGARYGMASEESFKEYISALAEDFMIEKITICSIAKAEGIEASDEEIKSYKEEMMTNLGFTEDELMDVYTEEDIIYYALADKVYDFLIENNTAVQATAE